MENVKELNELSIYIRNSFYNYFIQYLSYNLSYKLSQERYKIINCIIQENYSIVAESEIKNYFINIGYKGDNSYVFINFDKSLINYLFDTILVLYLLFHKINYIF